VLLRLAALAALLVLAYGCATKPMPAQFMEVSPQSAPNREAQTRRFGDASESELLAASVGVLQDLGFRVMASDAQLGVVTGVKQRPGEEVLIDIFPLALSAGLTFGLHPPEANLGPHDSFRVVLAMRNVGGQPRVHDVRITFYRTWLVQGVHGPEQRMRGAMAITSPVLYQRFFGMLSATLARARSGN
jgi:hypothetical protein